MSSVIYAVVFKGEVLEGFQSFSVKAHMANMLKADAAKMATVFSGKQIVLKRTPDKQKALKLGSALKKIGADVKVRAVKVEAPTADAQSPGPGAEGGAGGGLSLAPNEGNIVEPAPPAPPPDVDLSGISLAEPGEGFLVEPSAETEEQALDLSEYDLAEFDDSPHSPPAEEVPKLDAPDFGLDEPGAVLETLKVEVEEVHPDISALTIADPGVDLIDPADRPDEPAPVVPDVSEIKLVSDQEA